MKNLAIALAVSLAPLAYAADAAACDGKEDCDCPHDKAGVKTAGHEVKAAGKEGVKPAAKDGAKAVEKALYTNVSVDELSKMLATKKGPAVHVVDVNSQETREKHGIIPGAILLTSSAKFDAKELPKNKDDKVVFYCGSTKCTASSTAANRAHELGYKNVSVLPDGIKGWAAKGQKTDLRPAS